LLNRDETTCTAAHIERTFEMHERLRKIAIVLCKVGEVEARRSKRPSIARLLRGGERSLVGFTRFLRTSASLMGDCNRDERHGFDAWLLHLSRETHRRFERLLRAFFFTTQKRKRETMNRKRIGANGIVLRAYGGRCKTRSLGRIARAHRRARACNAP